jgi:hypothetical protein
MTIDAPYPSSDDSHGQLHRSGWTIGDTALHGATGLVWVVTGTNGENRIRAEGATRAEAWYRACWEARAVGMFDRGPGSAPPRHVTRF